MFKRTKAFLKAVWELGDEEVEEEERARTKKVKKNKKRMATIVPPDPLEEFPEEEPEL